MSSQVSYFAGKSNCYLEQRKSNGYYFKSGPPIRLQTPYWSGTAQRQKSGHLLLYQIIIIIKMHANQIKVTEGTIVWISQRIRASSTREYKHPHFNSLWGGFDVQLTCGPIRCSIFLCTCSSISLWPTSRTACALWYHLGSHVNVQLISDSLFKLYYEFHLAYFAWRFAKSLANSSIGVCFILIEDY